MRTTRHRSPDEARLRFQPHELPAALTAVSDRDRRLAVQVTQISSASASAVAPASLRTALARDAHYWLDLNLRGEAAPVELIVRLATIEPTAAETLGLGLWTCGGDDGAYIVAALRRIERWIARGGCAAAAGAGHTEGGTC